MTEVTNEPEHTQPIGSEPSVLTGDQWRTLEVDHQSRVDGLTADQRRRAGARMPHPVEDFLFTYYSWRPAQLRRWHPGAGIALLEPGERLQWRFHSRWRSGDRTGVVVDVGALRTVRGRRMDLIRQLLDRTMRSPGQFGCFGLHEWAMVYESPDARRHPQLPLRLGTGGTDEVVRTHQIRCSHHDAFRFFTPSARPLNVLAPEPDLAERTEQPGCLHASMDLYKWAYQLIPLTPSSLLIECFLLAREIRELDMRASPYDLSSLGYAPVAIETPEGKSDYVSAQRRFAHRGQQLRRQLLAHLQPAGC